MVRGVEKLHEFKANMMTTFSKYIQSTHTHKDRYIQRLNIFGSMNLACGKPVFLHQNMVLQFLLGGEIKRQLGVTCMVVFGE